MLLVLHTLHISISQSESTPKAVVRGIHFCFSEGALPSPFMLLCLEGTGWLVNVTTPSVSMEVKGPQNTKLAHAWAVSSGQRTFPLLREW